MGVVYIYHLVLMARTLAVLSQALHCLVDESHILLIDVESQQAQSSCGAATDTVQELKCLTHQIIVVLVILVSQKVLEMEYIGNKHIILSQELCHFNELGQCHICYQQYLTDRS